MAVIPQKEHGRQILGPQVRRLQVIEGGRKPLHLAPLVVKRFVFGGKSVRAISRQFGIAEAETETHLRDAIGAPLKRAA